MASYQFQNYTIPHYMIRKWFCNENYSAEQVNSYFNISCSEPSLVNQYQIQSDILKTSPSEGTSNSPSVHLLVATTAVIFLLGLIFNAGLLTVLYNQKRFFKPSWYYVFNLAIADILVLLNMVAFISTMVLPIPALPRRAQMFLFPSLDIFLSSASMLSVAVIAVDRVLSVCCTQVPAYLKKRNSLVKFVVGGLWTYCLIILGLALSRVFYRTSSEFNLFVFWLATVVAFVGTIAVTGVSYLVITSLYIKQKCFGGAVESRRDSSVQNLIHSTTGNGCPKSVGEELQKKKGRLIIKSFWISIAPLPFLMGWSFYLGVQTYEVVNNTFLDSQALNMAMLFVPWVVSALNPLVYLLTQSSLRKGVAKMFRERFSRNKTNSEELSDGHSTIVINL